ncbi:MAG: hypothetical protein NTW13_05560 [Candidatus Omnitrophica bacterium]|nr:hypothetical protein [Candidatus Omnitrophota bacterium]
MTDKKSGSTWKSLKDNFPWKDMFLGFLIPKVFVLYGARHGMPFLWGAIAIAWCVGVFYLSQVRTHKVNFFAIFAVIMIMARIIVVIAGKNPRMYLYVLALDNLIVGVIFMVSLLFKRSLMQLFADSVSTQIPQEILRSVYYGKAWRIVTFVWAIVYILFALALVLLKACNLKIVGLIDMLASWPLLIILFLFTLKFPTWYWKKNYVKIKAGK